MIFVWFLKLNRRISRHKVFDSLAQRGKASVDWFFGFKLHLVVNEHGQLLNVHLTPGNVDDRCPVPKLLEGLFGKIFAPLRLCLSKACYSIIRRVWDSVFRSSSSQYEE